MKFSFITCTYNRSELLKKNIESVKKNKFKKFEHFIVDDGSTDNTLDLVKKYEHIKLIKLNKNYGQPGAMFHSKVLNKVTGDYIILLDSDDYLLPKVRDKIVSIISKHKEVWSFSFDIVSKNRKKLNFKKKKINSKLLYHDSHPRFNNGRGYLDFLDIRKRIFYKQFLKYFKSPKYWYSSATDVYFKNNFYELFVNTKIVYYAFGLNNVTQGFNFNKYAPITLSSRKYIFNNFKYFMQKKYYDYHLKSLILNQLIFPGHKLSNLKLINSEKNNFLNKKNYYLFLFLLLIPNKLLFFTKKLFKHFRITR
tara:strand:- start:6982 stop:7905 length:924 start_codon:yes stop_codon:yes gene_type:complete